MKSSGTVWLASRFVITVSKSTYYAVSCVGGDASNRLYALEEPEDSNSNIFRSDDCSNGVRPVISMKSGLKISGGSGSESNPWQIDE